MSDAQITIPPNTLWTLLLCTVRYAMGRSSYIVGEACDLMRRYRGYLTPAQGRQIRKEVLHELEFAAAQGRTLGMDMDQREWERLAEDLK